MRLGLSLAGAAVLATILPADGLAYGAELRPAGKWRVDYGEAQCVALRDFTAGNDTFLFGIRPAFGGGSYELMLSRAGSAPELGEEAVSTVDFGQGPINIDQINYKSKGSNLAVTRLRVPDSALGQLRSAKRIEFKAFGRQRQIEAGSLQTLMAALDACARDLEKYWNYGIVHAVPAKPERDIRQAFSSDDYPQEAFAKRREGQSQYAVMVDTTGKIAGCDLVRASGNPSLDFMGCQVIMKRVKFSAAKDSRGRPVREIVITPPVRWVLQ